LGRGLRRLDAPRPPWSIRLLRVVTVYVITLPNLGGEQSEAKARELRRHFPEADVKLP